MLNRFFAKIAANPEKRTTYIALMPVFLLKHHKTREARKKYAGRLPIVVIARNKSSTNGLPRLWR